MKKGNLNGKILKTFYSYYSDVTCLVASYDILEIGWGGDNCNLTSTPHKKKKCPKYLFPIQYTTISSINFSAGKAWPTVTSFKRRYKDL